METTEEQQQVQKASKKKEMSAWLMVGLGALVVFQSYTIQPTATLLGTVAGIVIYHGLLRTKIVQKLGEQ